MGRKLSTAAVLMGAIFLSTALYAAPFMDSHAMSEYGVIEMVSQEESSVPGYFHQKYVYWHESCPEGKPVDYYGPAIDPNDMNLLKSELRRIGRRRKLMTSSYTG